MTGRLGARFAARFVGWPGDRRGDRLRRRRPRARGLAGDPFAALGTDCAADLTDDDVRSAWRRIAAATHPDRADGGDPERFAAAAAAYTDLRTGYGRGEARAALGPSGVHAGSGDAGRLAGPAARVARGRPARLALRIMAAVAVATTAVLLAGHGPAAPALVTGAATWLVLTGRRELTAPDGRYPGSGPVATGRDGSDDQADQEPT
jgi:hypothetical protein